MSRTLIVRSVLLLAALGAFVAPVTAAAAADTCQGKEATIVKPTGTVVGTDGDDVIVGGRYTVVRAGAGNDTVCVIGGKVDGGTGVDSVEVVYDFSDEGAGAVDVIDFEKLDVRTFLHLGEVNLEWSEVPTQLSGLVDASYSPSSRASKVLDNPTVNLKVPETSEFGLRVDRRNETVSLGEGLDFTLTGVNDIGMTAHRIRAFGDAARNFFFLTGCDVVARGGDGPDRLWMQKVQGSRSCPGVRLYGQADNDKMLGTPRNDVLVGGQGRDRADALGGRRDRCIAEKKTGCER
jgi:hypothetical protein